MITSFPKFAALALCMLALAFVPACGDDKGGETTTGRGGTEPATGGGTPAATADHGLDAAMQEKVAAAIAKGRAVVAWDQADGLGTRSLGHPDQFLDLILTLWRPVVERINLAQPNKAKPLVPRDASRLDRVQIGDISNGRSPTPRPFGVHLVRISLPARVMRSE